MMLLIKQSKSTIFNLQSVSILKKNAFKIAIISFAIFIFGCTENKNTKEEVETNDTIQEQVRQKVLEFSINGKHPQDDSTLLRIAFLGDAEPKPLAEFPNMDSAVLQINELFRTHNIDFIIGVGDIAHKGTEIQYEAATEVLQKLEIPFYPIMGNEEHGSTVDRYLHYAQKWNSQITNQSYIVNHDKLAFVFASPDYGRDFNDDGARWILQQLKTLAPKPVILIVHGAQVGVYPENPDKGISNQLFIDEVISQPNLSAVISGDLHMDMARVNHSKKIGSIHYLHIPALERTKIPDETNHTPMFRVMSISKNGNVSIDTYTLGNPIAMKDYNYSFTLWNK